MPAARQRPGRHLVRRHHDVGHLPLRGRHRRLPPAQGKGRLSWRCQRVWAPHASPLPGGAGPWAAPASCLSHYSMNARRPETTAASACSETGCRDSRIQRSKWPSKTQQRVRQSPNRRYVACAASTASRAQMAPQHSAQGRQWELPNTTACTRKLGAMGIGEVALPPLYERPPRPLAMARWLVTKFFW